MEAYLKGPPNMPNAQEANLDNIIRMAADTAKPIKSGRDLVMCNTFLTRLAYNLAYTLGYMAGMARTRAVVSGGARK